VSEPAARIIEPADSRPDWQILIAHGAGSTAATARSLLAPLLESVAGPGSTWSAMDDRSGDVDQVAGRIRDWLARTSPTLGHRVVCGISLGAHAAVLSSRQAEAPLSSPAPQGYVLALPAWIGNPDAVASATAQTGQAIDANGLSRTLADIDAGTPDDRRWLVDILRRDWSHYREHELSCALLAAAGSAAPTHDDLASVTAPTLVIGATEDPLHPLSAARSWACAIGDSILAEIDFPTTPGFVSTHTLDAARRFAGRVHSRARP